MTSNLHFIENYRIYSHTLPIIYISLICQKCCTDMTGAKQELGMCFGHITLPGSDMMEKFFGKFFGRGFGHITLPLGEI